MQRGVCFMQVMQTAPDIFNDVLYPWLPAARNPCYLSLTGDVKCLPFMSIIGVSKCGTTDMWSRLMDTPCALQDHGGIWQSSISLSGLPAPKYIM